jgi:ribonuclease I
VLTAYEFERHAGCKTKHPNNHIYFENGKTIYQIVQELRSTPESMLFDVIQTVFGAPINQKSFRIWKGKGYICLTLCLLYV